MALRALMLGKKLGAAKKSLEEARATLETFETREAELEKAISEAETDEEKQTVEEEIAKFDAEKADAEKNVADLEAEVDKLERELADIEQAPVEEKTPEERAVIPQKEVRTMKRWRDMSYEERSAVTRDDHVQSFIGEVRKAIAEKRAISNVGYLIPDVMMGILRAQVDDYSALIDVISKESLPGTGRLVTENNLPEAVWTEACANLNELDLTFGKVEFDGYKVGGYIKICNASLEDSDIDLAGLIIDKLSKAIALALDKAILYGTGTKMPVGIVTALAAVTSTPNINTIDDALTGQAFIDKLMEYAGLADSKYGRGEYFWVMNHKTHMYVKRQTLLANAAGVYVTESDGKLPAVGGNVIELGFMPDNVIVGGIGELYKLVERKGVQFSTTDQRFWTEDQTAFKATARYDGKPLDTDAFSVIGINDKVPAANDVTFAGDSANL